MPVPKVGPDNLRDKAARIMYPSELYCQKNVSKICTVSCLDMRKKNCLKVKVDFGIFSFEMVALDSRVKSNFVSVTFDLD